MKVMVRQMDLSDEYIRFAQQIGADGIDIHNAESIPGFAEQFYPDKEGLAAIQRRIETAGMKIYRVAPPELNKFLLDEPGGEEELDNVCKTIPILGELGIPFMSTPIHVAPNPGHRGGGPTTFRGGYTMYGFDVDKMDKSLAADPLPPLDMDAHFQRMVEVLKRLVPLAENYNVKLITHPSDPPLGTTSISPRRWAALVLDEVPSDHNGLLYCIGTRYESGVDILEDIRFFGHKGKIFHTHCRNVRGQIPTAGGYEELAMDDGDMNMFKVLQALRDVGFEGGLQVDHVPEYSGDDANRRIAWAYAVGYIKATIAALYA